MERYIIFLDWKNHYYENDCTIQNNLQIQYNLYQIPVVFFTIEKALEQMETQNTLNSWSNLEKAEWSWKYQPSWLQTILQRDSHQDSVVPAQKTEI